MHLPRNLYLVPVLAMTVPLTTQAAEWSAEPKISLRTGYNDNIRLTAAPHDSVWETALSPSVKFGVAQEHQGLSGDARLSIRRFTGGDGRESSDVLDREDYHFNTDAWHNTLRDSFRGNLDYTRDSTLDSELDQTGNVVDDRATRDRFTLGPSWTRMLTELTRLELSYQYTNVDYSDDPGISNLVGYDYHVASASLLRQLTPRTLGTLAVGFNSYLPDTDFDSDTITLQAGLTTNFSETLEASVLAGQRETTSDSFIGTGICVGADPGATFPSCTGGIAVPTGTTNTEVDTSSATYSASITKTFETGSVSVSLSRSTNPSSDGELLDRTRAVLTGEHKFTETLRTSLRVEYTENETIVNRVGFVSNPETEDFFRVTPKIHWRWSREWSLTGEYQYATDDQANADEATRNAVYVTLSYRPPKRSLSR